MSELQSLTYNKKSDLALFHMNIKSLQFHSDELETFFQMLGITESRIKEANPPTVNIMLPGFTYEHMPTKSASGGALQYIKNGINYKLRPDLNINKDKELESIFIEILTKNSKNLLVGCIYRHLCMHPKELKKLLTSKLNKESNK